MAKKKGWYMVYDYGDEINPGKEIKIKHSLSYNNADISDFVHLSVDELKNLKEKSVLREKGIFETLRESFSVWEEQAAETLLLNLTIDYNKIPETNHTNNIWVQFINDCGHARDSFDISNAVYRMNYRIIEDTKWDKVTQMSIPVAWYVSWGVYTNSNTRTYLDYTKFNIVIAQQDRKKFVDKAAMEKYIEGRKKAYTHLFKEIFPAIPVVLSAPFYVNGRLLPNYTILKEEVI